MSYFDSPEFKEKMEEFEQQIKSGEFTTVHDQILNELKLIKGYFYSYAFATLTPEQRSEFNKMLKIVAEKETQTGEQ